MVMKARLLGAVCVLGLILTFSRAESGGQEYIVILKDGQSIGALNRALGTQTVRQIPNTPIYLIKTDGVDNDRVLKKLNRDKSVEHAEKNGPVKLRSTWEVPPSTSLVDQMASLLDGHTLTTFYGTSVLKSYIDQPALTLTGVNEARSLSTGAATRVAYIDTGVDFYHPALRPWLDPGIDLVFNRSASELDGLGDHMTSLLDDHMTSLLDRRFFFLLNAAMTSLLDGGHDSGVFPSELSHGTLVAGIIHVVAPEARIVPIKAFDAYGNTTMFRIVEAVYRAKDLNVDVLNMSFSINEDSAALQRALTDAQAAGIALVAAAGNDSSNTRDLYPAAYGTVIGVAATDFNDRLASFSNFGKSVSVSAPGAYVVSTVVGGRYAAAWGTSFSSPMVSGAIALLASQRGWGHSDSAFVLSTADFIDNLNPGFERQLGRGRINVRQALKRN